MDRDEQLAAVLGEFARTMLTDFPIQTILDRLVERIVDVLPVTAAGVTLISDGADPHFLAASNDAALQLEKLQSSLGQGPCVTAYQGGAAVSVPDITADHLFPDFVAVAADVGMVAVFAFPMRHNEGRLGALDLFRDSPGPLDEWATTTAQTLADVAAAYLLNARARQESDAAAELLRAGTLHDSLTGLPNRLMLQERLEHAAERAQRSHAPAAVLFADLDGFKRVNDTFGHHTGDALLVAVATRLSALLRPGDTLARVSGDEFVILCEDMSSPADVGVLAARIDAAFAEPFSVGGHDGIGPTEAETAEAKDISITASVGIAFAGRADEIANRLIRDADAAMYQAKRKGGAAHQVIDLHEETRAGQRFELQIDLRTALERDELLLAYQPIVRAVDGSVTGVEALLRWTHPVLGPMPALSTITLAEESPLILEIGRWVLERSMLDRARWLRDQPQRPLDLAVNVSPRQLMAPGFVADIARVLASRDMDPAALVLEMTESIFIDDSARAMTVLADLKDLGVVLALDDFGTGYSSLSYLRHFPVDIVKIDQGFVADIGVQPTGAAIVAAVTNLAHALGLGVTAEGVETTQQRDEIVAFGCESAQGFHYARPMTAGEIGERLQSHPSGPLYLPDRTPPAAARAGTR